MPTSEWPTILEMAIASAPHEETLMVATRIRDTAFKRALSSMAPGSAVKLEGPSGELTLHNDVQRTRTPLEKTR